MKLIQPHLKNASTYYFIQSAHRKNAIHYAIAGINSVHDANIDAFKGDSIFSELEGHMKDWVTETLVQGAFIREYHIWEKDTKEYFNNQLCWNNDQRAFPFKRRSRSYVENIREVLPIFSAQIPSPVISAIDYMRTKVNTAKHEPGLLTEHFVTQAEYDEAAASIDQFWEELGKQENFRP